jgi:hypothetical protein
VGPLPWVLFASVSWGTGYRSRQPDQLPVLLVAIGVCVGLLGAADAPSGPHGSWTMQVPLLPPTPTYTDTCTCMLIPSSPCPLYPCVQISMTFKNQQVLKDCTWEVKKGERVGLVGGSTGDRCWLLPRQPAVTESQEMKCLCGPQSAAAAAAGSSSRK